MGRLLDPKKKIESLIEATKNTYNEKTSVLKNILRSNNPKKDIEDAYYKGIFNKEEKDKLLNNIPETYCDRIIKNINNFKKLAYLHPRIALVGVDSEIENIFQEINPYGVKKWADKHCRKTYPETIGVREEIREYHDLPFIPEDIRISLTKMYKRAGECRHTRPEVSILEVEEYINNTIKFIDKLKTTYYPELMECSKCKAHVDFHLSDVLDASPGSVLKKQCPEDNTLLFEYEIPDPCESIDEIWIEESQRTRTAISALTETMKELLEWQHIDGEMDAKEYEIKVKLLEIVSGPQSTNKPLGGEESG